MVQVIGPGGRKTSFQEQLLGGLEQGLNAYSQYQDFKRVQNQERQQRDAMKQLGLPENINPELAKIMLSERLKAQGKQQLMSQKQEMLEGLFGGSGQGQAADMGKQLQAGGEATQDMQTPMGAFDASAIPDEVIARAATIDPNIARSLQHAKDVTLREKREAKNIALQEKKMSPEFQRQQHLESSQAQADVKYNQSLQELSRQHELKEQTLNRLEALNKKGVTGKPYEKLLEKSGLIALTSEGRREFAADVKNLITDIRSILGGQFSQAEFMTILNAYPSADFSKEANAAIIKNLKEFQDIKTKEVEFANQLKKANKGKIPQDFQSQVNDMVREYAASKLPTIKENARKIMNEEYGIPVGKVLMFDPQGEPLSVAEEDVQRYESLGATLP